MDIIGNELIKGGVCCCTNDALRGKKVVGLYFSAHWCPPCRGFTPQLAQFYKRHSQSKGFEIIFISSDQSEEQFNEYFASMPWLALPFRHRHIKENISRAFCVTGIPHLVFLDVESGDILCSEGRGKVCCDPNATSFPWA